MSIERVVLAYVTENSVYEVDHTGPGWLWRKRGGTWQESPLIFFHHDRLVIQTSPDKWERTTPIVAGPLNVTDADVVGWFGNGGPDDPRPISAAAVHSFIGEQVPFVRGWSWAERLAKATVIDAIRTEDRVLLSLSLDRALPDDVEWFRHGYPLPRLAAGMQALRSKAAPDAPRTSDGRVVVPIEIAHLHSVGAAPPPQDEKAWDRRSVGA